MVSCNHTFQQPKNPRGGREKAMKERSFMDTSVYREKVPERNLKKLNEVDDAKLLRAARGKHRS